MNTSEADRVSRSDKAILVLLAALAIGFAVAAVIQQRRTQETIRLAALGQYNVRPEEVIGRSPYIRGRSEAAYVLIEFGDYECGPCRAAMPSVKALLHEYKETLAYVYRDLPLTTIHPHALDAAVIANRAARDVDYWAIHDLLFSARLDAVALQRAARTLAECSSRPLPKRTALRRVQDTIGLAKRLGIGGTPSFVLVCPDNVVRRIQRLEEVRDLLEASLVRPATSMKVRG